MGDNCIGMKTLYEKASNLANYVRDIMYMQRYYMDCYAEVSLIRTARMAVIPNNSYERIRGYSFETANPNIEDAPIFQILKRENDYRTDYIMTLTSSYTHIKNNTISSKAKYVYVQHPNNHPNDIERSLSSDQRDCLQALRNGISTGSIKETEFQQQLIQPDYLLSGFYMMLLLLDDLNKIQYEDKRVVLCLGSTDIKTFIPARKALIDLLDTKVKNDWRETILKRYGHSIG